MSFWMDIAVDLLGRDRTWRIGRSLYMRARGEKTTNDIALNGEAALVREVIRASTGGRPLVLLDIGGNLGEWSETALYEAERCGRTVDLHVFEPSPVAAERLGTLFAGRATVHRVAVSDRTGTAEFAMFGDTAGTNSLLHDPLASAASTITVDTVTGAEMAGRLGLTEVDLVKIDTEGHDCAVLEGFAPLLEQGAIGVVQFEYNSRWLDARRGLKDVFALAAAHRYRIGRVMPSHVELFDGWNPECDRFFEDNFVLVRADLAASVGAVHTVWTDSNTLGAAESGATALMASQAPLRASRPE